MGLRKQKQEVDNTLAQLLEVAHRKGLIEGYDKGYDEGYEDGYNLRKNEDKPALSDGLRYGSPECGRSLRKL